MSLSDRLNRAETSGLVSNVNTGLLRTVSGGTPDRVDQEVLRGLVNDELKTKIGQYLYAGQIDTETLESAVFAAIGSVMEKGDYPLTDVDRAELLQQIVDDILGNGPLEQLLRDPDVSEIMVVRYDTIYVERRGKLTLADLKFTTEDHLRKTIDRIVGRVGRRIDESSPLVDARLLDGSRVNAVVPPIALDGANITIRKFFKEPFTARDMLVTGTITPTALEILEACVRGRLNIVISGGTGSGKTTTLNVLSSFIPEDERIVTIEDSAELQLTKPHVIRLETRPANIEGSGSISIRELVRNSLRMRPDRIVVGEVRDGAALDMLQAMNTGHDGSLTTVHANNPLDAVSRLETMGLMAGMELPVLVIRDQIGRAIDLIVQQSRLRDGSRHITAITEIIEVQEGVIKTQDLFKFEYYSEPVNDRLGILRPTGGIPTFVERLAEAGVNLNMASFQR
jgi:pilus assembly protein CpaF